jgi:hypothetical protein
MPASLASQGYAAQTAQTPLAPYNFARRAPGPYDVQIDILFAASVIPTCTRRATNGTTRCTRWCPAMKSSAA